VGLGNAFAAGTSTYCALYCLHLAFLIKSAQQRMTEVAVLPPVSGGYQTLLTVRDAKCIVNSSDGFWGKTTSLALKY
jgi:hypothetical protein